MKQDEKRINELNDLIKLNFELYLKRRVKRKCETVLNTK